MSGFRITGPFFCDGGDYGLTKERTREDGVDHVGAVRLDPILWKHIRPGFTRAEVVALCFRKGWKYEDV